VHAPVVPVIDVGERRGLGRGHHQA
jgi:hypothetical protein